jgi:hypothetical protein
VLEDAGIKLACVASGVCPILCVGVV